MLFKNQILTFVESGQNTRILDVDLFNNLVWLFDLAHPKALPRAYSVESVEEALREGLFVEFEAGTLAAPRKFSEAATARRDQAYDAIEPLIQHPGILDALTRGGLVRARAKALHCSEQTLYKYLRTWWRGGQSKQCLMPGFHRIGGKKGDTRGRGRPSVYLKYPIYQVTEIDRQWMKEAIHDHYLTDKTTTASDAYQKLLDKHYSYLDGEGRLYNKCEGECPSIYQFRWFLNQLVSKEQRIRARHGDAEFELNHRPKLGSLRASTYTIGQFYEIDATVVDVLLVHESNRSKIIGKPVLYTIRERKSGLITGLYIGLENASWIAAMQAIKFISEDKAELCRKYDLPYDPEDWPAHRCFPQEFIADRGAEMLSNSSTQLADGLEIVVRNLPTRRADWKPHVECGFKQLQQPLANVVPGYTPPKDSDERQKRDRSQDAALTLKEFTRVILQKVIQQNKAPLTNNPMDHRHILDGLQPTPINIWNTEVRERAGLLTRYSEAEVLFALLPKTQASISREGIRIGDCFYSAPEALKYGWFVQAGDGRFQKTVSYDLRLVNSIYVHDENHPNGYFVATLVERCRQYAGLSFAEAEAVNFKKKVILHQGARIKHQLQADFNAQTKPMVDNAVALKNAATKGKSRSARKKDTVEARTDARRNERQETAQLVAPPLPATESAEVIAMPQPRSSNAQPKSHKKLYQDLIDGN
ncbi:MAG: hypothetical protein QM803_18060 [Rhodocyclaceae bacterium]